MKISISERDIHRMVNECVSAILREEAMDRFPRAPRRDVRQIILNNILAKHPEFNRRNDLAWAYYSYFHKDRREGNSETRNVPQNLPEELTDEMMSVYQEAQRKRMAMKKEEAERVKKRAMAFREWWANPENRELFKVTFNLDEHDLTTEEGCFEALKALGNYSSDMRGKSADQDYSYTGADGEEKSETVKITADRQTFDQIDDIEKIIMGKLYEIQYEYGLKNFKEMLYYCENNGEPSDAWTKRKEMADNDEFARWFAVPSSWRCWSESYCPKYRIGRSVDSSD